MTSGTQAADDVPLPGLSPVAMRLPALAVRVTSEDPREVLAAGSVSKALGEELRRARNAAGWTRDELVERIVCDIEARTLATYEHGTRQCTVVRLVEICAALGVSASDVLGLALQRAHIHLDTIGLQVDLAALRDAAIPELRPLRGWARNRLAANIDGGGVAYLTTAALQELAMCCGLSRAELIRHLAAFAPRAARQVRGTAP